MTWRPSTIQWAIIWATYAIAAHVWTKPIVRDPSFRIATCVVFGGGLLVFYVGTEKPRRVLAALGVAAACISLRWAVVSHDRYLTAQHQRLDIEVGQLLKKEFREFERRSDVEVGWMARREFPRSHSWLTRGIPMEVRERYRPKSSVVTLEPSKVEVVPRRDIFDQVADEQKNGDALDKLLETLQPKKP